MKRPKQPDPAQPRINSSCRKILAIPDIHFPYHDERAIAAMLDAVSLSALTGAFDDIIHLGDLVDHLSISRFSVGRPKDMSQRLIDEWRPAAEFVKAVQQEAQCDRYWQLQGNHESRLNAFIERNPAIEGAVDLCETLGIDKKRWINCDEEGLVLRFEWQGGQVTPAIRRPDRFYSTIFQGVSFIHGWRHNMHHSKSTAELSPWPGPIICGDSHDEQVFSVQRWGQDKPTVHTFGYLGAQQKWTKGRATRWVQGFGIVYLSNEFPGVYRVEPYRIYDGKCIGPNGDICGRKQNP